MAAVRKPKPEPVDDLRRGPGESSGDVPRLRVLPGWEAEASTSAVPPSRPEPRREETTWHAMSIEEVVELLGSSREVGLPAEEAERRLQMSGPNIVELPRRRKRLPWWRTFTWGMPAWPGSCGTPRKR